jgi:hypothetical protein
MYIAASPAVPDIIQVIPYQQRTTAGTEVYQIPCLKPLAAQAAF